MAIKNKALIVGINFYAETNNLFGCVNDAEAVKSALERHENGEKNFDVKINTASNESSAISRSELRESVQKFFRDATHIALFYFSGHGFVDNLGGYLITSECGKGDAGFSMHELLQIANSSPASHKIIVLDCCHSGYFGNSTAQTSVSSIANGLTILSAADRNQYALEKFGTGLFTSLLVDALYGGSSNILGEITPASVYAHIDQSLGAHNQRPIFKTNTREFTVLKKVKPSIQLKDLKQIIALFKKAEEEFPLDPTFEYTSTDPKCIRENVKKFKLLQKMRTNYLVEPIDEEHMYYAAMNSTGCRLTRLGKHYWRLVKTEMV